MRPRPIRPNRIAILSPAASMPITTANFLLLSARDKDDHHQTGHNHTQDAHKLGDDEEPVPRDGELSQGLLELFTNVENLRLSHMRWGKLRVDVQGYFLQGQPTLTVLQLTDVEFPKLTDLLNLARSYSELREIHLTRVVWSVEQGPGMISRRAYSPPKAPLHLEALSVYECTSPGAFVNSLLPPGYGGELRRISLEWGELEDPTILRDLIRNAGSSLRSLAIDLSWQGSS